MDQLSQEFYEFYNEVHKSHTGDDNQDDSTNLSCSASSKTKTSEDGMSDNRSSDELLSFHQSPGSGGSEASTPEKEFSRHFDLNDLEPEVLDQALQDSSVEEEEPVSAASQLIPDPEPVVEEPQSEEVVPDHDLVRATIPEPEPEKYIRLHITEEQTVIPQEFGSESSSRRKSNRISKPVEKFVQNSQHNLKNSQHNLKRTSKINHEECEKHHTRGVEGKTSDLNNAKREFKFKREFGLDKNKGCIPGKTAHREYQE